MQRFDTSGVSLPAQSLVIHDAQQRRWLLFQNPVQVWTTNQLAEVMPILEAVQQQADAGYYAAGWLSYEASPAFDPSFQVQPDAKFPLIWFGIYSEPQAIALPTTTVNQPIMLEWTPSISSSHYQANIARIKNYIAQGMTYQVNYSYRLRSAFTHNPWQYFTQLMQAQNCQYGALINLEDWAICCASPELFFQLNQSTLKSLPMKGTAPRGLTYTSDRHLASNLRHSAKNQAENLMIVDMIRNDMGRIAETGSVQVRHLFEIEQYPTVWQMTTPVECQTHASFAEIMRSLFPCASITGAPKPSTMRIIAELEDSPRRIYTGTIGFLAPHRTAQFNVAIRTVLIDRVNQQAEYGVGGGIVWDSIATDEFEECRTKAKILTQQRPPFDLLESLLWQPESGYFLLDLHLQRLQESAAYFAYPFEQANIQQELEAIAQTLPPLPHKVRLLLSPQAVRVEAAVLDFPPALHHLQVGIAKTPVYSGDLFLYHKTTHRLVYERAKQAAPNLDEVLLWNERGELTEFCTANLVVEWNGHWYTPPVECGLLGGTYRNWLLQQGKVQERILYLADLPHYSRIFAVNSVRGIREAIAILPQTPVVHPS